MQRRCIEIMSSAWRSLLSSFLVLSSKGRNTSPLPSSMCLPSWESEVLGCQQKRRWDLTMLGPLCPSSTQQGLICSLWRMMTGPMSRVWTPKSPQMLPIQDTPGLITDAPFMVHPSWFRSLWTTRRGHPMSPSKSTENTGSPPYMPC